MRHWDGQQRSPGPGVVEREPAAVLDIRYASSAGRWLLTAAVLGSGIASLDATVVGIALPAIGRAFSVGVDGLQWVVNAYTLTLAGLLLLGGTLGDRFGRRRVFVVGVAWFAVASIGCGLAPAGSALIGARALQGVGAALLTPGSLAILQASFVPDDRSRAIGAWSGLGGVASAAGPFLGGWLIASFSWRLIFSINVPVALAVAFIAARHVPESRAPSTGKPLDLAGAAIVTLGLVGLTYGLIEGTSRGWGSPLIVGALCAGVLLLAAFVLVEHRSADPMLPLRIFRSAQFSAANAVTFVVYAALGGTFFLLPVVLQEVAGYSPLQAGAALLPVTVLMLALSSPSGALAARIGPRLQMTLGPIVIGTGLALLARIDAGGGYLTEVLPGITVFGLGLAINVAPLTSTALGAAPPEHAGVASAVNNDVARAAGLIAVAVLPALAGITGRSYADPAALQTGFHTAVLIAAATCVAGGVLAAATIRNPLRARGTRPLADLGIHCAVDAPPLRPPAAAAAAATGSGLSGTARPS